MKPRNGENPPLISNSKSQIWRGVRSQEGHSREWDFSSLARSESTMRLTSSPPCGAIRWLVDAVKCLNLQVNWCVLSTTAWIVLQTIKRCCTFANTKGKNG